MAKPITPAEIGAYKATVIPEAVIEAFNELIAARFTNGEATVKSSEVELLAVRKLKKAGNRHAKAQTLYDNGWMNVEEMYREAGWRVKYDRPGYNESYAATYVFTPHK